MKRLVALGALLLALAEPARAQIVQPPAVLASDVATFTKKGTGIVSGRLVVSLRGDRVRYFDHWLVYLVPVIDYTYYFTYRIYRAWMDGTQPPPAPAAFARLTRSDFTDEHGYFSFKHLAEGPYFVFSVVQVKDGRQQVNTYETFGQTGTNSYTNEFGELEASFPVFGYTPHQSVENYTCLTQAVVGGTAVVKGDEQVANIAIFGSQNDGC